MGPSARPFGSSLVALLLASVLLTGKPANAQTQKAGNAPLKAASAQSQKPDHFTAFAVNMSGSTRVSTATVDIIIDRYSTDAEREKLFATLMESNQDKLLNVVQDMPS